MAHAILPNLRTPDDLRALPVESLQQVADEIRHVICEQVKSSGGHLAPNLGVVELTVALHYVFDFGHDRLLFDVGHQCYPHKLLTGRYDRFATLRQTGGISGFPEPAESRFDLFSVGHAGTSISTAVGMARGDSLNGEGYDPAKNPGGRHAVALIGDASIANGVAMEGLNAAGTLKRQFLVVLNDNGMSIARPQGALAKHLDELRVNPRYIDAKKRALGLAEKLPGGTLFEGLYHRFGEAVKDLVSEDSWFTKFGLLSLGPVDGHDLPRLVHVLRETAALDRPVLLHVHTVKGKGFGFAEDDATRFHSPAPFSVHDEGRVEIKKEGRSFTAAFATALADVMRRDPRVVAATAAMPDGTGIDKILAEFPDRAFDTGICESHAMDMMAGLAKTGWKPFFAVYSTFLQRAFDQAFQEVALQGLPVRLCLDRAGLVGGDGAVHHGFCDVSILRVFPKACLMAAMDEASLAASLEFMRNYDDGISCVRYPRDTVSDRFASDPCPPFEIGRARALADPHDPHAAIFAFGTCALDAMKALDELAPSLRVSVYDARFAKPVDIELLRSLLDAGVPIVTVEDHGLAGGFGSCVIDAVADAGLDARLVRRLGIPERWIPFGSRSDQKKQCGIDPASIAAAVRAHVEAVHAHATWSPGFRG
ncbi:MAG: 1-deoxy-D-xylulose-5-phosphate synthase [Planctomycetes bacterium]|nr:1-deoxy-D-xylulose-5-phosphate synthase [Planctomycetota bacterium]